MSEATTASITVYSDYVCPFCYLGRESLSRYQADRDKPLRIDWRPFDLRAGKRTADGEIDHSVDDGKDDDYFEQAKESVRRLQQEYDVEMTLELATEIDSLDAQVASAYVSREHPYETWLAFDEAIFAALWQDGRDIGSEDVLVDLQQASASTAMRSPPHSTTSPTERQSLTRSPLPSRPASPAFRRLSPTATPHAGRCHRLNSGDSLRVRNDTACRTGWRCRR